MCMRVFCVCVCVCVHGCNEKVRICNIYACMSIYKKNNMWRNRCNKMNELNEY
jgi:hypothetical protein